jgi:hypothetical protein
MRREELSYGIQRDVEYDATDCKGEEKGRPERSLGVGVVLRFWQKPSLSFGSDKVCSSCCSPAAINVAGNERLCQGPRARPSREGSVQCPEKSGFWEKTFILGEAHRKQ